MTLALDDILLALLGGRPCSAYDLWQRHADIFGTERRADIVRVMAAISRLERAGFLRIDPAVPATKDSSNRRTCELTPAGRRRRQSWLCDIAPEASTEDLRVRGLLAVESADEATFDTFLTNSLTATRKRMHQLADDTPDDPPTVRAARAFDRESVRALALWLHQLPDNRHP